jgi:pseudouridine synthase
VALERLQKILSGRGLASRRRAEEWIRAGRVRVNGVPVMELGAKADPDADLIEVDGTELPAAREPVVVLLHKPAGYVATVRDPHAERTVMELLEGLGRRVYPVGRLDRETRGVLLLTDDGDLANALLHPSRGVEKVYEGTVRGDLAADALNRLALGVELEDGPTLPASISNIQRAPGLTRFRIALREGRKRQVRLMVRAVGARVADLARISFAGLTVGGLAEGQWRILKSPEVAKLKRLASAAGATGTPATVRKHRGVRPVSKDREPWAANRGPKARDRNPRPESESRMKTWTKHKRSRTS